MTTPAKSEQQRVSRSEWSPTARVVPILGFLLGLVACVSLIVVAVPTLVRNWAASHLTSLIHHEVEIDDLTLNFMTGHLTVTGFRIRLDDDHSELVSIAKIHADIEVLRTLRREVRVRRVDVVSPKMHLIRTVDSGWLLPFPAQPTSGENTFISSVVIQRLELRDGTLIIEDHSAISTWTDHLQHIQLSVMNLSTTTLSPMTVHGSAQVFDRGSLLLNGSAVSDFRSGTLGIDLSGIALARVQDYLDNLPGMKGLVDARLSITWPGKGPASIQIGGSLEGHNIEMGSADHLSGRAHAVTLSQIDILWPNRITVDRVLVMKPEIWVRRNESGHFAGVIPSRSSGVPSPSSRSHDNRPEDTRGSIQWSINEVVVHGGIVHIEDRAVSPVYTNVLRNIEMSYENISSVAQHPGAVTVRADIASGGALDIHGHLTLSGAGPTLSLKAVIRQFVVPSTNPYLSRTLAHYTTDGMLTSVMELQLNGDQLQVHSDVTLSDLQVEPVRNSTHGTVRERIGLPLGLLIALLKDETGRIIITFPISGPLSNPTFDWTNAFWTTIRNSVMKLIALPLRSIGSLFKNTNHVDEVVLTPITFTPGVPTISSSMERMLRDIARLMSSADRTILHIIPILHSADLDALQRLQPESWPVPNIDTPETAGYLLAVRRAYLVAARIAGLKKIPATRLHVLSPQPNGSAAATPRVELRLENPGGTAPTHRAFSESQS
ncbi:MAG TPA: DUF748 domain-containing protein [Nitrospira sp.]|nr:DUF748 domain-containing protein [Nitrospira sp.]